MNIWLEALLMNIVVSALFMLNAKNKSFTSYLTRVCFGMTLFAIFYGILGIGR